MAPPTRMRSISSAQETNDVAHAIDVTSDPQCPTDPTDCVRAAARGLAGAIARLHAAGAAAIIVPNLFESFGAPPKPAYRQAFDAALTAPLAAARIAIIAADLNALRTAIANNHGAFGIHLDRTGSSSRACTQPANINSSWAMLCSPNSTVSTINPADAALKFLFADDGHLTTARQEIVGDYFFCLLYERLVKAGGTTIGNPRRYSIFRNRRRALTARTRRIFHFACSVARPVSPRPPMA